MVDRPISTGMSSISRTIAIILLLLAILNAFDHVQARANKVNTTTGTRLDDVVRGVLHLRLIAY